MIFPIGSRVSIQKVITGRDGDQGRIVGVSSTWLGKPLLYIVLLDQPIEVNGENHEAISVPGGHLGLPRVKCSKCGVEQATSEECDDAAFQTTPESDQLCWAVMVPSGANGAELREYGAHAVVDKDGKISNPI